MVRSLSRSVAKPVAAGATLLAVGAGIAASSASSQPVKAFTAASPPATVAATAIATPHGALAPGTVVAASRLGRIRVFTSADHGFALAGVHQAAYPVTTLDGGGTWRINGPPLHVNAAQAPLSVLDVGAASSRTYFACCGGQTVDVTHDAGRHWWRAILGDVVMAVVARFDGRLIAFTQVPAGPDSQRARTLVYVSRDGGRHWHLNTREGAF